MANRPPSTRSRSPSMMPTVRLRRRILVHVDVERGEVVSVHVDHTRSRNAIGDNIPPPVAAADHVVALGVAWIPHRGAMSPKAPARCRTV